MIRAVIVDDEKKSREVLKRLIEELNLDVVILGEADSVEKGFEIINDKMPQLVFLDVEMLDGTGFNLLEKFGEIEFKVIFITAYDQYAIKAFKYSAIDYLLKPIDIDELENAFYRAKKSINREMFDNSQIKVLLDNIKGTNTNKRIAITSATKIEFVNIDEIICCNAEGSYVNVILTKNRKIFATKSLKYFDALLNDDYDFFRISKSCLINLNYLRSYKKNLEKVELENGMEVDVARRRKKELLERVNLL